MLDSDGSWVVDSSYLNVTPLFLCICEILYNIVFHSF